MNKKYTQSLLFALTILLLLSTGCSTASTSSIAKSEPSELFISAASSMTDSVLALKAVYEENNPDTSLTINFGSSGSLQRQIEQGSPVDVFISASQGKMNALEEQNLLLESSRSNLLENKLVLIAPNNSTVLTSFEDLTVDTIQHFAIGEPDSVPAGKYAKEALTSMDLYSLMSDQLIFAKNVREVLTWVETGNAEGGLVYETDALISEKVTVIATADSSTYTPIIYPVAIIQASKEQALAESFIDFLYSDQAKAVFESYGFHMAD